MPSGRAQKLTRPTMDSGETTYRTGGGVTVTRTAASFDPAGWRSSPSRSRPCPAACSAPAWSTRAGTAAGTWATSTRPWRSSPAAGPSPRGPCNDRGRVLLPVIAAALARTGEVTCGGRPVPRSTVTDSGEDVHRGGAQPPPVGLLRAARDHRRPGRARSEPRPVRGVRLRPGLPVRAGPAPASGARRPSATWSCTCPTGSGCWTASGRRRCATPTTSRLPAGSTRGLARSAGPGRVRRGGQQ